MEIHITATDESSPFISGNYIFHNNTTNNSMISRNTITGNLWGITNTGNALPKIGQVYPFNINIGENFIYNNGNDGEINDLYNNTPNDISELKKSTYILRRITGNNVNLGRFIKL